MTDEERLKKWEQPATRGDLIIAMMRTQAVTGALIGVISASISGDRNKIKENVSVVEGKFKDFTRLLEDWSGLKFDE